MRTRSRYKEATLKGLPYGEYRCVVSHAEISDVNNGKDRPQSPCYHKTGQYFPQLVRAAEWRPTDPLGHVNIPSNYIADIVESLSGNMVSESKSAVISRLNSKIASFSSQFSSLNFAYELREVGSLFKSLHRYRYIDWQFGIAPMIADVKKAMAEFESLARSSKKKAWDKDFPFSTTKRVSDTIVGPGTPYVGNPHGEDYNILVTTRLNGTISVGKPYLANAAPDLYQALDSFAIDPSAGNAWEAIPWSWFVDWFIPVGEQLDAFPSLMKPEIKFIGSLSTDVRGFGRFTSIYAGPAWAYLGGDVAGYGKAKIYSRQPLDGVPAVPFRFRVDSLSNPSNIALLRDIMFPVKRG